MQRSARRGRVYWVLLGMLLGLVVSVLMPITTYNFDDHPKPRWERWPMPEQRAASAVFWCCWIGTAIGIIVDLGLTKRHEQAEFQLNLRSLLLLVAVVASGLFSCLLYMKIMTF